MTAENFDFGSPPAGAGGSFNEAAANDRGKCDANRGAAPTVRLLQ